MTKPIVTRFAPSPTGFTHIGSARTALFAYLWAQKNNGTFILRIEDTDRERYVAGAIEHMKESLRWLGIDWTYGPDKPGPFGSCIQSERLDTYRPFAEKLIEKGFAYPDPYTPEQVEEYRKQSQAAKKPFLFRDYRPETLGEWDGKKPLRFKVPEVKRYTWHDEVRGDLEAGEEALDDFVLIKSDGYPTYNFAHIIDDYLMGVTHIMRADEFIASTPRFLSLYDALEIERPAFVTLPPILREDRTKKLGKRDGAKDILEYRSDGFLPDALVNFIALVGWNPGTDQELFDRQELIEAFDIHKIQKAGGVLNEEKLHWFNKSYLSRMDDDAFMQYIRDVVPSELFAVPNRLNRLLPVLRERTTVRSELHAELTSGEYVWVYEMISLDGHKVIWKDASKEDTLEYIQRVRTLFTDVASWTAEVLKTTIWDYATEKGRGAVLWPIRYALTGRERSPDPFIVAYILGKEETLQRLDRVIDMLS